MKEKQKGWTSEQREWFKKRDSADMEHPQNCQCQWHTYQPNTLSFKQCLITAPQGRLEGHHIYPQSQQRRNPKPYGGNNPYNGIMLCSSKEGSFSHHDLLSPQMIVARARYRYDRNSYEDAYRLVNEAEDKGISMHDFQYDGMLKAIARARTDLYLKRFPLDKFPKDKYPIGESSLPNNGTIFDNHVKV